ncbi:dTDP-4-dehydrorhamnose 3,5-epimerase [Saccharopolyspora subtropica]|uniref:dTDP-4-dehydrorhamnose 3,5-epimerase n=1 Tax=Saccharopolyspora thermophila TaxID=89367 RepID=A0A917N9I9_9PSEU|nr:dTDP-4-dehydrorhamnose 3,5-epimerase family protein [Saccharopolyspora subtropica]GGI80509.1 dTDP-4-dehydrorhamnose 3,5-epimerase [Saccharopolyspora subtropica]
MISRELAIPGAFVFEPESFPDDRGFFVSPFEESEFTKSVGHPPFPVAQVSYSVSRRGVVRGPHFTRTPPGVAKYVYSPRGRVLDVVVDLRLGSPAFGRWESVLLGDESQRAVYLPVGVAHMFVALQDESVMTYLLSSEYVPANELAISPFDPGLALPVPEDVEPILSARDQQAPTLAEAKRTGLLPDYEKSLAIEAALCPW